MYLYEYTFSFFFELNRFLPGDKTHGIRSNARTSSGYAGTRAPVADPRRGGGIVAAARPLDLRRPFGFRVGGGRRTADDRLSSVERAQVQIVVGPDALGQWFSAVAGLGAHEVRVQSVASAAHVTCSPEQRLL